MLDSAQAARRDRDAVTSVVTAYEAAFNGNDAAAMNALFAEDAVFVNVAGNLVLGATDLRRAQEEVFAGPLREVHVRYTVESVRLLRPDIAVVHARQRPADETGALLPVDAGHPESVLVFVLSREPDGWRIRAGQNTFVGTP